jgi:hypothetical protein
MKKTVIALLAAFLFLAAWHAAGHCEIEQEETAMGEKLESEESGNRAGDAAEMEEMEMSMDTGGETN